MDIEKICRCCLALSGPLLSIYDGGSAGGGCVADMLKEIAKVKPQQNDNMPEKACLQCISEINRCFMFRIKCENSNRTLRQLLPEAVTEQVDVLKQNVTLTSTAVQTEDKIMISSLVQTVEQKPLVSHIQIQTMEEENLLVNHKEVQTEFGMNIPNAISIETRLEKYMEESVSEDFIIYEKIETPTRKRKKSQQISPAKQELSSRTLKKRCFENSVQDAFPAVEETTKQEEAYILLEDSNMDSNCSGEQEIYLQNQQEGPNSNSLEYYEKEEEERDLAEEIPASDQQSKLYPEDAFIYCDNLETDEDLQMNSSEIMPKPLQESKASSKKPLMLNTRKGRYKCSQCTMTFVSIKVLRRHLANRHNIKDIELIIEDFPHEPQLSDESEEPTSTNTGSILQKHLLRSNVELSVDNVPNPQLCPRERVTSSVNEEMLTQIKYFCDYCQAGFAQRKTLNYHKKHNICMTNNFKCNKCERIFVSQENLDAHMATYIHEHKCLECHKIYKTIEQLSEHMIEEHNRNARNQCHVCKKVFTMKTSLMDHLRIHSGEKPFLCTVCGKSFRQNSNLRQHLLRHTNAKNFKCDTCPDAFITKAELLSHQRTHTGDHPFKCDECSACFTTSCSLQKHKRKHTGERPYACEFCPLRFAALNVLKNHRRTHTGEKPFSCDYCEKSFTQKGDCLMHQRTHISNDFKCQCGSKFTKKSNFKNHIKTQHPNLTDTEITALINRANKKMNSELHITLFEDDDVDLEVDIDGGDGDGVEDQSSDYDNIANYEQREGDITESLNDPKNPNINSEEIMHIVLDDVI